MGGIGKTQTAIAYVHEYKSHYECIYWISAATEATLLAGFRDIATWSSCMPSSEGLEVKVLVGKVLSWFRMQDNWLLVIDNLDHIELIDGYLPERSATKHTLITTRNPDAKGIPARGLEVPLMSVNESIEMLYALSEMTSESDTVDPMAEKIVQELGYLPLAIGQAAAFIREVTRSFKTFLSDYRTHRRELHEFVSNGNRQYSYSIASTWLMSFNHIERRNPAVAKLLQLLSFLNPDGVSIDFLILGKSVVEEDLGIIVADSLKLAKALMELEKFSLIRWSREAKTASIHRLVQTVVRDQLSVAQNITLMSTVLSLCDLGFPRDRSNESFALRRRYERQIIIPLSQFITLRTEQAADVLDSVGWWLSEGGEGANSELLMKRALEIRSELSTSVSVELRALISLCFTNDESSQAGGNQPSDVTLEASHETARPNDQSVDEAKILDTINSLARIFYRQGRVVKGTELQEKLLSVCRDLLGEDHVLTIIVMNDLAMALRRPGHYARAAEVQEELLAVSLRSRGEGDYHTLIAMSNLSVIYMDEGRLNEAVALQEKAFAGSQRLLGEDHFDTIRFMEGLGTGYFYQGQLEKASELLQRALTAFKRLCGEQHPLTATTKQQLGRLYWTQGRLNEALTLIEEALATIKHIDGEDDPHALHLLSDIALLNQAQGKIDEAIKRLESCLDRCERALGKQDPHTLVVMYNLAEMYYSKGRLDHAIPLQKRVVAGQKATLGEQHFRTLHSVKVLEDMIRDEMDTRNAISDQDYSDESDHGVAVPQ
jgi:tetratricopeptide (TPR) repeat protein